MIIALIIGVMLTTSNTTERLPRGEMELATEIVIPKPEEIKLKIKQRKF